MQTGIIYTLTDPRDDRIRYVGQTTKTTTERLAGHLAYPTNPAMRVWIHALALQGLTPRITAIATPPVDRLSAEEEKQIAAHHQAGHRIFNSPHYHRNLSDLCLPPKAAEVTRAANLPPTQQIDKYAHALYGRLAAERTAGLKSTVRTALGVAVNAPILAVLLVWATLNVKPVRVLCFIGLVSFGLWEVGFDHLLREEVLPHLPLQEVLDFWHEYLKRPMTNLGWIFLGMHLIFCLGTYLEVDAAARASGREAKPGEDSVLTSSEVAAAAAAALEGALPKQADRTSPKS
ncbi:hypothetical protein [Streptomyces sp. NPDC057429]|uniref:hypothetical protein n=1 Tax=Streptomyces sp. NPDC057429 TaxID=3346130 RepID=UPI0036A866DD